MNQVILFAGHSLYFNPVSGMWPREMTPGALQAILRKLGCNVDVANLCRSGETTANASGGMLYRLTGYREVQPNPACVCIGNGENDPGNSISTAQTTLNLRAFIMAYKFGAINLVAAPANLPATENPGVRYLVLADDNATGGIATLPSAYDNAHGILPTVTGAGGSLPTVWECVYPVAGATGWRRVANSGTTPSHCTRFVVVSSPYLNYSAGGDNAGTATVYAAYNDTTGVRKAQLDAVAAEAGPNPADPWVIYADVYNAMKARIVAGIDTQGNSCYSYKADNQHPNAYGSAIAAQAIADAMCARRGWLAALATP